MLDPYTAQASINDATTEQKIEGLKGIINSCQTAMLTTRSADGQFHSRAMTPATPHDSDAQLLLTFIANNVSHKFEEIQNDSHVNVSFLDPETTDWASFSGKAKIIEDRNETRKYWSQSVSAWFGNLGDGVHNGDLNDPRVALIQVIPDEIRYWHATKNKIEREIEIGTDCLIGMAASPGELFTINKKELKPLGLYSKN